MAASPLPPRSRGVLLRRIARLGCCSQEAEQEILGLGRWLRLDWMPRSVQGVLRMTALQMLLQLSIATSVRALFIMWLFVMTLLGYRLAGRVP